jgi:hypothetical protein
MKLNHIQPIFCKFIPDNLEYGNVYISEEYNTSTHLCACGCGILTVLPIGDPNKGVYWIMTKRETNVVSFHPSVGNHHSTCPTKAHYFIVNNKIIWQ